MRILVDEALPVAVSALRPLADVATFPGRVLAPDTPGLEEASALVVRSVSRVDATLLAAAPRLRIVATATIGVDHLDIAAAVRRGVLVARAPGCNAEGVADWTLAAILEDAAERGQPLFGRRVGVVGAGQCGRRVAARVARLGMIPVVHDPPRAYREGGFRSAPLAAALACDVVTLHVPLTRAATSDWPTWHVIDVGRLDRMREDVLLVNAARGGLVDEAALVRGAGPARVALDTFVGEPRPAPATVARAWRATPHIAGATFEGKWRAQAMAAAAVAEALGLARPAPIPSEGWPAGGSPTLIATPRAHDESAAVELGAAVVRAALALAPVDAALRALAAEGRSFDPLRDGHRRHDLAGLRVAADCALSARSRQVLAALGLAIRPATEDAPLRLV